jgi:hypothetical protein
LAASELGERRIDPALIAAGAIPRRLAVPREVHAHAAPFPARRA